jgi:hypothetical protein
VAGKGSRKERAIGKRHDEEESVRRKWERLVSALCVDFRVDARDVSTLTPEANTHMGRSTFSLSYKSSPPPRLLAVCPRRRRWPQPPAPASRGRRRSRAASPPLPAQATATAGPPPPRPSLNFLYFRPSSLVPVSPCSTIQTLSLRRAPRTCTRHPKYQSSPPPAMPRPATLSPSPVRS